MFEIFYQTHYKTNCLPWLKITYYKNPGLNFKRSINKNIQITIKYWSWWCTLLTQYVYTILATVNNI